MLCNTTNVVLATTLLTCSSWVAGGEPLGDRLGDVNPLESSKPLQDCNGSPEVIVSSLPLSEDPLELLEFMPARGSSVSMLGASNFKTDEHED